MDQTSQDEDCSKKLTNRDKQLKRKPGTNLSQEMRQKQITAFTRYCQGESAPKICKDLNLSEKTLASWRYSHNWSEGRRRVLAGEPYHAPFMDDETRQKHEMPRTWEDILASQVVIKELIREKFGDMLWKIAQHGADAEAADLMLQSGDFQKWSTTFKNVFGGGSDSEERPQVAISITADGIRSAIVDDRPYETRLPISDEDDVIEAELVEDLEF
jgi:hypothetical protein